MYAINVNFQKEDFDNYLKNDAIKNIKDYFEDVEDDEYFEGKIIYLENKDSSIICFDLLFLIDMHLKNGGYAVIYIKRIKSNSEFGLWLSGIVNDEDDEEEEEDKEAQSLEVLKLVNHAYKPSVEKILNTYI
jgi:hypothetical protein